MSSWAGTDLFLRCFLSGMDDESASSNWVMASLIFLFVSVGATVLSLLAMDALVVAAIVVELSQARPTQAANDLSKKKKDNSIFSLTASSSLPLTPLDCYSSYSLSPVT